MQLEREYSDDIAININSINKHELQLKMQPSSLTAQ